MLMLKTNRSLQHVVVASANLLSLDNNIYKYNSEIWKRKCTCSTGHISLVSKCSKGQQDFFFFFSYACH